MAKKRTCPQCNESAGLRKILYGMPAGPPDPEKYVLGGCVIYGNDPEYQCINCNWSGSFKKQSEIKDF